MAKNERLKHMRVKRGWTQEVLAELLVAQIRETNTKSKGSGIDADYISRLERGVIGCPVSRTRQVFREVFEVDDDAELGFFNSRLGGPRATGITAAADLAEEGVDAGVLLHLFQLPPSIGDFTGRDDAVDELIDALTQPFNSAMPIAAVSGPGGIGKTALALRVSHNVSELFPDGQLYVDLRGTEPTPAAPIEVLGRFLNELGVDSGSVPDQLDDRSRLFRAQLAGRRVLVVLDNAAGEQQVRPLLPGDPDCAVLVTSRRRLLALESAHHLRLEPMGDDQALDLLASLVGEARIAAEPDAAERIVEYCGRFPLAIRIAGARLASRPGGGLASYAELLGDERRRLHHLRAGDLEVRASFALSYDSCIPDEQQAFRMLGVLTATDFAAWTLAVLTETPVVEATELLERLVDAQLIEIAADDASGHRRYRFHDLLRVFARERLDDGETAEVRRAAVERLVREYVQLGTNAAALLEPGGVHERVPAVPAAVAALEADPRGWFQAERSAFVAGVTLAYDAELWSLTWRLAELLPTLFRWQSDWRDWEATHDLGLRAAERDADTLGVARIRCSLGLLHRARGQYPEAIAELQASADMFAAAGDELRAAIAKRQLGDTFRYTGQLHDGIAAFAAALEVFERIGNARLTAGCLNGLGDIYRGLSRWQQSTDAFTRCIELYEALGDVLEVARARVRFGIVYRDRCLYAEAEELSHAGLAVFEELSDQRWQARTLRHLGIIYRNIGDSESAVDHFEQALDLFTELADHRGVAVTTRNLGDTYRRIGELDQAAALLADAMKQFRRLGDIRWEARTLIGLADIRRRRRDFATAAGHLDGAMRIYDQIGDDPGRARIWRGRGVLLRDQQQWQESLDAFDECRRLFETLGDSVWTARAIAGTAATLQAMGDQSWVERRRAAEEICETSGAANSSDDLRELLDEW